MRSRKERLRQVEGDDLLGSAEAEGAAQAVLPEDDGVAGEDATERDDPEPETVIDEEFESDEVLVFEDDYDFDERAFRADADALDRKSVV